MSVESDRSAATITALAAQSRIPAPTHAIEVSINGELVVVPAAVTAGQLINVPTLVANQLVASGYLSAGQVGASGAGPVVLRKNR